MSVVAIIITVGLWILAVVTTVVSAMCCRIILKGEQYAFKQTIKEISDSFDDAVSGIRQGSEVRIEKIRLEDKDSRNRAYAARNLDALTLRSQILYKHGIEDSINMSEIDWETFAQSVHLTTDAFINPIDFPNKIRNSKSINYLGIVITHDTSKPIDKLGFIKLEETA